MKNNNRFSQCVALLVSTLSTINAFAQLEEVIVTAQKREQSLQDVPLAMTAVSAEMIEQNAINTLEDMNKLVPSLRFSSGGEAFTSSPRIRGVGTDVFSVAVESNVGIVIDGVPLARSSLANFDFSDIERIEVLRGPQGTLFGKNTSAGLVHIVTADPAEIPEAYLHASYEQPHEFPGDLLKAQLSTSGPLTDSLGARLSGYAKSVDGHLRDTELGENTGGADEYGLRGKLRWDPTETLSLKLGAEFKQHESEPGSIIYHSASPELKERNRPTQVGPESRDTRSFGNNLAERRNEAVSLTIDWDINGFTLTAISAYRDATLVSALGYPRLNGESIDLRQGEDIELSTLTQELRLSSPAGQRLEYTIGALWFDNRIDRVFNRAVTDIPPSFVFGTPSTPSPGDLLGTPVGSLAQTQRFDGYAATRNLGVFAHSVWHVTDQWHITAGARLIEEEMTTAFDVASVTSEESTGVVLDEASSSFTAPRTSIRDRHVIGTLSLQYDWGEHSTLYSTVSTGYRGGAFDLVVGADQQTIDDPVDPETSRSLELGIKSRLLDNRLEFEFGAFLTRFRDFQAQILDLSAGPTSTSLRLANAGELQTRGLEFEFRARPTDALFLYGALLYNKAEFKEFVTQCFVGQQPGEAGGVDADGDGSCDFQDASGGVLPNAPEWSGSLTARYEQVLGNASTLYGQLSGRYQSEVQFNAEQHPLATQDGYGIVDLRLGWRQGDRLELAAYVNNALQQHYVVMKMPLSLDNDRRDIIHSVPPGADRVFGTAISLRF